MAQPGPGKVTDPLDGAIPAGDQNDDLEADDDYR
jgi:hypothetical protein